MKLKSEMSLSFCQLEEQQKVSLRGREVVGEATVGVEVILGATFSEEVKVNVSFRIGREGVKEPEEEEMLLSVAS